MGSEHLSTYEVTYEEDTPLYAELQAGTCVLDDDLACAMYETLIELSASRGFVQYEVSNFAQKKCGEAEEIPAEACRHNVNYWRGGPFVGVGPSAAEFMDGIRTRHWANTTLYCEQLEQGRRAIESKDELPPLSRAGEIAAFGLRMNAGWPYAAFQSATGFDLREHWSGAMDRLVQQGWAIRTEERFRLTDAGLRFADTAGEAFLVDAPAPVRNKIDATLHGRHPVHHDT